MFSYIRNVVAFILLTSSIHATDVWYDDAEGKSLNERYVATSKSPENRKKNPGAFQSNFSFELYDTKLKKTLWNFKSGEDDEPGGMLYVSDQGEVIRLGGWQTLWLIRKSGEKIKFGNVFDYLPKGEVNKFCYDTTAGIFWQQFSKQGFERINDKDYFYIRTYWGRYIVIDISAGSISKSREVQMGLESKLLKESKSILTLHKKDLWLDCKSCGGKHPSSDVADSLMILELHKIPKRERIIDLFRSVKNNHMFDVVDYIDRMRKP